MILGTDDFIITCFNIIKLITKNGEIVINLVISSTGIVHFPSWMMRYKSGEASAKPNIMIDVLLVASSSLQASSVPSLNAI